MFLEDGKQIHLYYRGKEVLMSEVLADAHWKGIEVNLGLLLSSAISVLHLLKMIFWAKIPEQNEKWLLLNIAVTAFL